MLCTSSGCVQPGRAGMHGGSTCVTRVEADAFLPLSRMWSQLVFRFGCLALFAHARNCLGVCFQHALVVLVVNGCIQLSARPASCVPWVCFHHESCNNMLQHAPQRLLCNGGTFCMPCALLWLTCHPARQHLVASHLLRQHRDACLVFFACSLSCCTAACCARSTSCCSACTWVCGD